VSTQTKIAEFVTTESPQWATQARPRVRDAFVDTIACAIAGRNEEVVTSAISATFTTPRDGVPLWFADNRSSPESAALINAAAAHALDYDDVSPAFRGHPSAVLFPALLALAHGDTAWTAIFDAYSVGFEVSARLGRAVIAKHYPAGWHSTSTLGVIGATAACCHLLGLPAPQVVNALGLAASQSAGMQENFGTMAKPLHAGFAAAAAIRATCLARAGIDASPSALDGARGFVGLYAMGADLAPHFSDIGSAEPEIVRSGIETKYLAICYAAHRAAAAAAELRAQHCIDRQSIERIEVVGSPRSHDPLLRTLPNNPTEAKFSIEYAVALMLLDGSIKLSDFSQDSVARPDLQQLMKRVTVTESSTLSEGRVSDVTVRLKTGESHSARVSTLGQRGEALLMAKVDDCLEYGQAGQFADLFKKDLVLLTSSSVEAFMAGQAMSALRKSETLRAMAS
jgi:2-methylcitrate dehydratase PrpD